MLAHANVMGIASQQADDFTGYDRLKLILHRGDALPGKRVFTRCTRSFPNMVEGQEQESPDRRLPPPPTAVVVVMPAGHFQGLPAS